MEKKLSDFVPRRYHEQQVNALTLRSVEAENILIDLLGYIDPDIMKRNHNDWLAAVRELMPAEVEPAPPPPVKKRKQP